MLTETIKQEIRDRLAKVATAMPGFRPRPGQRLMIAEIAKAFGRLPARQEKDASALPNDGSTFLCIKGGTGIGKSLAYCVAGAVLARHAQKTLVIASSTVALQEQLISKDLPFFLKAADLPMSFELAKGRTRYVCEYKLRKAVGGLKQGKMFDSGTAPHDGEPPATSVVRDRHLGTVREFLRRFEAGEWNGDRDLLVDGVADDLWETITTDRHGCLSRRCPNFKTCAQAAARQRFKGADIVVANHDLVLMDLLNGGQLLPKPEDAFYVFDEGHHLPAKAVNSFASSHLIGGSQKMLDRLQNLSGTIAHLLPKVQKPVAAAIVSDIGVVQAGLSEAVHYFGALQRLVPTDDVPHPRVEFEMSLIPEHFVSVGENIVSGCIALNKQLDKAIDSLSELLEAGSQPALEQLIADIGAFMGRVDAIRSTWDLFIDEPRLNEPPIAKWVETATSKSGVGADYQLCASPVVAADRLRQMLWDRAAGAVLCSANLTILGDFTDFLRRSGLSAYPETTCIDVPSPFDYGTQGVLIIPPMKVTPKDVARHTQEVLETVAEEIRQLAGEGMLVLFTSRRQMEDVYHGLPEDLRALALPQGSGPKTRLIAEHTARVDRGEASVIFGLESFSEGVDLVGKYCTVLIVTKLPFATPDDPVQNALAAWVERRGGSPFLEISVPDAFRKLEQRVGRLIRTEQDVGKVVVLDSRLWTTGYGRRMLQSLPPFRVMAMGKEVHP